MNIDKSITLIIQGKAYQFDVSKYTTCDDVITMARRNFYCLEDNHSYAVFESAFGTWKLLSGNTKVLKQIRSWGISKHRFALEVRKVDDLDEVKSKMAPISRARKTLKCLRTMLTKYEQKSERKLQTYLHNNLDTAVDNKDRLYVKNITVIDNSFETEKQEMSDVSLPIRSPGDGRENVSFVGTQRTPGVGEESDDNFSDVEDSCYLNNGFISDQFESESSDDKDELNECAIYENDDMSLTDEESAFGDVSDSDSICELERNVIDPNNENSTLNLNDCVIYEDEDIFSIDDESAFEDDSDCESLLELERNVLETNEDNTILKLNQIKAMFSKGDVNARINEDDLMDSFMQTFIDNDDNDEGMESDCSDLM